MLWEGRNRRSHGLHLREAGNKKKDNIRLGIFDRMTSIVFAVSPNKLLRHP
jgi:hypothetical protein